MNVLKKNIAKFLSLALFSMSLQYNNVNADEYVIEEYKDPGINMNYAQDNVEINFLGAIKANVTVLYCNGRLCIPLLNTVKSLGGSYVRCGSVIDIAISGTSITVPVDQDLSNRPSTFYYNGVLYISIYDFLEQLNFVPVINLEKKRVVILGNHCNMEDDLLTPSAVDSSTALLRLEDIVADGVDTQEGQYSVAEVERLRYATQYLYTRRQQYYIAWVPVYVNPKYNIKNDLSTDYNLYNSYFLYVLDYMTDHGGHIGLHGYTHQYGNERSTVGNEWGEDTPYSKQEQVERFILARQTCAKLGYVDEFFEFPHYAATKEQLNAAENYFKAIYQSYRNPDNSVKSKIYINKENGKDVYYIPTPADYVKSANDREIIINTIQETVKEGNSVSMFYHPYLDKSKLLVSTKGRERFWYYSYTGILPGIVNYIGSHHFVFSTYD